MRSIYALTDPWDELVRYIGQSRDPQKRLYEHMHMGDYRDQSVLFTWLKNIKEAGLVPGLLILEQDVEDSLALKRERHWIEYYHALDAPLLNLHYNPSGQRMIYTKSIMYAPSRELYEHWKAEHERLRLEGKRVMRWEDMYVEWRDHA